MFLFARQEERHQRQEGKGKEEEMSPQHEDSGVKCLGAALPPPQPPVLSGYKVTVKPSLHPLQSLSPIFTNGTVVSSPAWVTVAESRVWEEGSMA